MIKSKNLTVKKYQLINVMYIIINYQNEPREIYLVHLIYKQTFQIYQNVWLTEYSFTLKSFR